MLIALMPKNSKADEETDNVVAHPNHDPYAEGRRVGGRVQLSNEASRFVPGEQSFQERRNGTNQE